MKKILATTALVAAALITTTGVASAGQWTCQNPAGNPVQGQCNGQPHLITNPGGNTPPGQNK